MLTELLLAGLGTWVVWEWLLSLTPFRVPPPLQPLLVVALAYALVRYGTPETDLVLASAALVAILHAYLRADPPERVTVGRRGRIPRAPGK